MSDSSYEIQDQSGLIKNVEAPVVKSESIQPPIKEIPKSIIEMIKISFRFGKTKSKQNR